MCFFRKSGFIEWHSKLHSINVLYKGFYKGTFLRMIKVLVTLHPVGPDWNPARHSHRHQGSKVLNKVCIAAVISIRASRWLALCVIWLCLNLEGLLNLIKLYKSMLLFIMFLFHSVIWSYPLLSDVLYRALILVVLIYNLIYIIIYIYILSYSRNIVARTWPNRQGSRPNAHLQTVMDAE